jgi:Ribbon-helix-helix protein, copG family
MQTDRLTILMEPKYKASIARQAAARGVSTSEHVRNALDSFDAVTSEEQAELAVMVAQANEAIPKMRASIDRMIATLDKTHRETDAFLVQMGVRS